ncbi:MAG: Polymer biosynthesis protein WecB/TagA/CpsF family [Verrucomicrobiales bacterium]|nr:Polymer biosynthesis protein WecB/TagA/CpsF family [Verrucomicrobiales bacterium]
MKILVFYPYVPYPLDRGTYQRTFHLLRELSREHDVDLLALVEKGEGMEHKAVFEQFCKRVDLVPFQHPDWPRLFPNRLCNSLPTSIAHWSVPGLSKEIESILHERHYDLVHCCDIVLAQYFLKRNTTIPLSIDRSRVDLQFQLAEHNRMNFSWKTKLLRYEGYAKMLLYEKAVARRASLEVVCGIDDEIFVRRWISRSASVQVLVNGVDLDYFYPTSSTVPRAASPTVLFCGAMDYNPNIDALRWYFANVHDALRIKIPDLQVLIVGKNPVVEIQKYGEKTNVIVTGGVPDVRPFYRRAWMQIVPLRIGGGSRLKIVESLAMGTPVVSTTIGAQGLGLVHNDDILLGDTPEEFVNQTARALQDESLRERIKVKGLETVCSRLSWKTLGHQLSELYRNRFKPAGDKTKRPGVFSIASTPPPSVKQI